ncbi:hypothetical protein G7059_02115 [Erysipelothrix sp. HDW6A]|uniref:hypothetical protein n=1 Tax=Erysipelothrix sp. HDW6A TaxID=2714928 RepID=UPI00140CA785|nr:hypothetical protein [Erysipelothrix sp. HDW6A]QIK56727.1 hypothetical protein G7059_02115 [Erysipelothrix sp. HDW6A]
MKLTTRNKIELGLQFIIGVSIVISGTLVIFRENLVWEILFWSIVGLLAFQVLMQAYQTVKSRKFTDLLVTLGVIILLVLMTTYNHLHISVTALLFGLWALFNAFTYGLKLFVQIKDKERGKTFNLLAMLAYIIMGGILFIFRSESSFIMNLQIGIYIILLGLVQCMSAIRVLFLDKIRVSFSPPVFIAALIPDFLLKKISKIKIDNPEQFNDVVTPTKPNMLSVYLYAKDDGPSRIGHLDIGYNGIIYSYGAHDNYNRAKTMAYGDGVLIVGSEIDFVNYAVDTGTTVFRFIVKLTSTQADNIENRINEILNDAYYYNYPYQNDPEGENYLTRLRQANLHVDFYKFFRGKFKTYNVLTTNCVIVADQIVKSTGMKLFQMSGVATPGAYYEYLDSQLNKPGSIVIGKEIYSSDALNTSS